MKKFLLSILCCLLAVVNGYAQGSDDFGTYFTKTNSGYGTGTTTAGWKYANAAIVSVNGTYAPTINGKTSAKGTITSPTLAGGCGTLSLKYAYTFSESKGVSFKVTIQQAGKEDKSYDVVNSSATKGAVYEWEQVVNVEGDFNIYITNNSPSNSNSNKDRFSIWNIEWTAYGQASVPQLDAPVISPESCTFDTETFDVTISAKDDATIYYTLDGSNPTTGSATYNGVITLTETTTVKAFAVKAGYKDSEVVEAKYTAIDPNATNYEIVASELGKPNASEITSLEFGAVTATFDKGSNSNATKYYTTGAALRAYGGNTITFTGAVGITITEIKFTFGSDDGSNAILVDSGTFSKDTWTGASNKVKFTINGSTGHRRIAAIEVTYSIDGNTVVIATPSITTSTSFVGSTTVDITNNEAGTTLYYSTNGEDYTEYTGALTISETTTVYAYSQDAEGNKSSVAEATFTKIEVLTIAEAKATYDNAGSDVDVAVDLTGAVVTVNSGQYLFIENETTGINLYNSGANYAVGTKFTAGYILGKSTVYGKMHQITGAEFKDVETTTVAVEPTEVEIADIKGNNPEYEGRFVKLSGVSIDVDGKTITKGEDSYALYNRFTLELTDVVKCDVEGIVAIYNTTEQLYITKVTPAKHTLHVTGAGYATLFLDFATVIPAEVKAYAVTEVNNGYVSLTQIEGILPANTGVIVEAVGGDYAFVAAANNGSAISGNKLLGTTVDTDIDVEAYVLSMVEGEVGLYKAEMAGGVFLNNANKAYLPVSALTASAQGASGFKFRFETTGVEQVEVAKGVKAIYDLSGRKVNDMKAPGLYIVNGKKVLVK